MKVKELVEELQKLDQERNVWLYYDCYAFQEPDIDMVNEEQAFGHEQVNIGDYKINAW